ncbi:TPA: protein translocase subunit SecD [Candidatus Azambacteria bacterium]|uniref:Protein translocase subunit SecD n=1 Tax=Candidatus Azambacteria bacterium GW2011_GWC1_46_13 TaxID=1618619 RepID=A0A0G1NQR0_9BACT|nr:MAG: Preprotein translocase subunit SecD [Candidatus Azambacteria bacterium GW2011_GWC1_46_13]HAQ05964.1 protein translocase subunit SecD [Candidatus Azambacteria bacterium]
MEALKFILNIFLFPFRAIGRLFYYSPAGKGNSRLRFLVFFIFAIGLAAGFFAYPQAWDKSADYLNSKFNLSVPHFWTKPYSLGLDLQGGTHLVYQADLTNIEKKDYASAMDGVRDVIERRVNLFGVSEPLVEVNRVGDDWRLIVELAGIKDVNQAIKMIGETPYLEFKEERLEQERNELLEKQKGEIEKMQKGEAPDETILRTDPYFIPTSLTGKYLQRSQLDFDQNTFEPIVTLEFNSEGAALFEEITKRNVGKMVAIYLDGQPISTPKVNEAISGGRAVISGRFAVQEAKELVQRLNAGALPVPISLASQQSVGASLGQDSLRKSLFAGLIGFLVVALFMIIYYRLPGFLAVLALLFYTAVISTLFKLIPVTLSLAGIAGFILSVGMAVDANILIFERMKEERRRGRDLAGSIEEGFSRAWTSIRDSNVSSLITCAILYWFGTSIVQGFALTLAIGILISMFSAISVSRTLLRIFVGTRPGQIKWLFGGK